VRRKRSTRRAGLSSRCAGAEIAFVRQSERAKGIMQVGGAIALAVLTWLAVERWATPPLVLLPMVAVCARALPQLQSLQDMAQQFAHARPALDDIVTLIDEVEAHAEPVDPARAAPLLERAIRLEPSTSPSRTAVPRCTASSSRFPLARRSR
jgi:hypothetical protein